MEDKNKILARVKKLLTLADKSKNTNLEEASVAAEKAQALMERHRIEQAMLDMCDALCVEPLNDGGLPSDWKVFLAYVLAKHNGCYLIKSQDYQIDNKILIVGEVQDTKTVQSLYNYFSIHINSLCLSNILNYQVEYKQLPTKEYISSFFTGAVQTVDYRLQETNKTIRNESICNAGINDIGKIYSAIQKIDSRVQAAKQWLESRGEDAGISNVKFKSEDVSNGNKEGFEAGVRAAVDLDISSSNALPQNKKSSE